MSRNTEVKRPLWVVPAIAFLIGLLIGWWVIGWWLWPVQWTNALPADLRAAERDQYLGMVAESYTATRNADLARERLKSWSADDLAKHLANLQARVGANTPQAAQVAALADLVGAARPAPQAPSPGPEPTGGAGIGAVLRGIGAVLLWLLLFVLAVAVVVYLWMRWRAAHRTPSAVAIDATARPPRTPPATQRSLDEIAAAGKESRIGGEPPAEPVADVWSSTPDDIPPARDAASPPPVRAVAPAPGQAIPPKARVAGGARVAGEYRALYQMGEPDYDEAFDITDDATGTYLGQCGLELNDPIGRGHDQAAALQAWLWDSNDPDTKVIVLMSEGAYRDTAMRDQLKGEHDAMPVRPGVEFELETYKVLLHGLVEKVEYADQDPPYTIFSELQVRFRIERKA